MAVNTFGPSAAALPAGAVARIGGGFTASGYGTLSGSFPAGQYLVKTNCPGTAHFGQNTDYRQFTAATKHLGTDIVVRTTAPTTTFEYISTNMGVAGSAITSGGLGNLNINSTTMIQAGYGGPTKWPREITALTSVLFAHQGLYYAYGSSTIMYRSSSGLNDWTAVSGTFNGATQGNAFASNGNIVVSANGTTAFYNTSPSTTAVFTNSGGAAGASRVVYGNGIFLAWVNANTTAFTSPDGINWTSTTFPLGFTSIAYGNGTFVAVQQGNNSVYFSTNGTTWTSRTVYLSTATITTQADRVAFANGVFLVTPYSSVVYTTYNEAYCVYSTDGAVWYQGANLGNVTVSAATAITIPIAGIGNGFIYNHSNTGQAWFSMDGITPVPFINTVNVTAAIDNYVPQNNNRGMFFFSSSGAINMRQPNVYFDVYQLDPSFKYFSA